MVRTIAVILGEAVESSSIHEIELLWKEIVSNKYKYPLIDLQYAKSYIAILKEELTKKEFCGVTFATKMEPENLGMFVSEPGTIKGCIQNICNRVTTEANREANLQPLIAINSLFTRSRNR